MTGSIKFYNTEKKFGFVKTDSGTELFFHVSNLVNGTNSEFLKEGARVSFEEGMSTKGPVAVNVYLVDNQSSDNMGMLDSDMA